MGHFNGVDGGTHSSSSSSSRISSALAGRGLVRSVTSAST
ncbi:hypothetical protein SEEJ1593_17910, partial [Salmonella enterica subsp. enterica serovar Javiana str. ATCC BAA-1593]